jgi:hypothetical protein
LFIFVLLWKLETTKMISFIFCRDLVQVRQFLLQLNYFLDRKDELSLLDSIIYNDESKVLQLNLNSHQLIFLESTESISHRAQSPFIFPLKVSSNDWISVLQDYKGKVVFQYGETIGPQVSIVEAPDGTRLYLGYFPKDNSSSSSCAPFATKAYLEYIQFQKTGGVEKKPLVPATVVAVVSETKAQVQPTSALPVPPVVTVKPVPKKQLPDFETWNPTYGRINPKLHPYLLHNGKYQLITPNSPKPIPFCNEYFEGHAYFLVNSKLPMSAKFIKRWENDKNCFEVQLQGKFRKIPKGLIYVGGEISKKMELGLFTRGLCHSILQFCKTFTPAIHSSFGDNQNIEFAHISSPFWTTVDRLVITRPTQTPPSLSQPFYESVESRKARKKSPNYKVDVNLEDIYSFSLKTSFVDIEKWNVIGIPLMKTMDLHTFWSEADLRFVAYVIDPAKTAVNSEGFPILHKQTDLQNIFALTVEHASNHPEWANNPKEAYEKIGAKIQENDDPEEEKEEDEEEFLAKQIRNSEDEFLNAETGVVHGGGADNSDMEKEDYFEDEEDEEEQEEDEEEEDFDFESEMNDRMALYEKDEEDSLADLVTPTTASKMKQRSEEEEDEMFYDANSSFEQSPFYHEIMKDIQLKRSEQSGKSDYDDENNHFATPSASVDRPMTVTLTKSERDERDERTVSRNTLIEPMPFQLLKKKATALSPKKPLSQEKKVTKGGATVEEHRTSSTTTAAVTKVQVQQQSYLERTSLVIAAVEIDDIRSVRPGSRRVLYAFRRIYLEQGTASTTGSGEGDSSMMDIIISNDCVLRSYNDWKHAFAAFKIPSDSFPKPINYAKLHENEQRRLFLDSSYKYLLSQSFSSTSQLQKSSFLSAITRNSVTFAGASANRQSSMTSSASLAEKNNHFAVLMNFLSSTVYNQNFLNYENPPSASSVSVSATSPEKGSQNKSESNHSSSNIFVGLNKQTNLLKYGSLQSQVCLRMANYAYSQEFIYYNPANQEIIFKNTFKRLGKKLIIPIKSVLSMKVFSSHKSHHSPGSSLKADQVVVQNYKKYLPLNIANTVTVIITTFSKSYLLLFHEKDPLLQSWLNLVNKASISSELPFFTSSANNSILMNAMELIDDTIPIWHEKNDRMILNHRHVSQFLSYKLVFTNPSNPLLEVVNDPVRFVGKLLEMILGIAKLSSSSSSNHEHSYADLMTTAASPRTSTSSNNSVGHHDPAPAPSAAPAPSVNQLWIDFMDGIAYLQWMDISFLFSTSPSSSYEKELLCIFLNLYHCMLIHCYLIMGLPTTVFKWSSFFRNCCYEAFGEIFSLAELEHNILRAKMNPPGINILLKSFLPHSKYPFALTHRDYRLLFAINCGSISNLPATPIYNPLTLHEQLENVIRFVVFF